MTSVPVRVGILGGGQLARMLAVSAHSLGVRPFIFADKPGDCATSVCSDVMLNDGSPGSLRKFIETVDVVTIENEFIDLEILEGALQDRQVFPSVPCLRKVQNKLHQKENLSEARISCLEYVAVQTREELARAAEKFRDGIVLKQAFRGYDGKGTFIFRRGALDESKFWAENPHFRGYAEPLAPFKKELAVVVARSLTGQIMTFPLVETDQEGGICHWAVAPARVKSSTASQALSMGRKIMETFGAVGVFGIEMFLLEKDKVVVNEIAPRVHNSGHWSLNGCRVSQFEQHLRAILGLPLLKTDLSFKAVAMVNILGKNQGVLESGGTFQTEAVADFLEADTWLYWYGKSGQTLKRKLGHVNAGASRFELALKKAQEARNRLRI